MHQTLQRWERGGDQHGFLEAVVTLLCLNHVGGETLDIHVGGGSFFFFCITASAVQPLYRILTVMVIQAERE